MSLDQVEDHNLLVDERRQCHRIALVIAQAHHFAPCNGQDVEALPQALAENEQLDSRRVAQRRRVLMHEAVAREGPQMAIDGRLRRSELARQVRYADGLRRPREEFQQAQRQVHRLCTDGWRSGGLDGLAPNEWYDLWHVSFTETMFHISYHRIAACQ